MKSQPARALRARSLGIRFCLGLAGWLLRVVRFCDQAATFEQRPDVRIAAREILELLQWIFAPAAREQGRAETIAILALQAAVLFEPAHRIGVEHFAPD